MTQLENKYHYTISGHEYLIAGTDSVGDSAWYSGAELNKAKELYADDNTGDILFMLVDGRKAWFQSIDLGLEFTSDENIHQTIVHK